MPRIACFIVGIVLGAQALPVHAQPAASDAIPDWEPWKKRPAITVVSVEKDSRLPLVDEAVTFWNDQFISIGSGFRLGAISHTIGDIPAYQLHSKYPRPVPITDQERLALVASLHRIKGDILVVMTESTAGSFASSLPPPGRKVVIVINRVRDSTISEPVLKGAPNLIVQNINSPLNWIAHELGHSVGLDHNKEEGTLMCSGTFCLTGPPPGGRIYPLGNTDKSTLIAWYPRNWRPH